jgi:hypothetical protein
MIFLIQRESDGRYLDSESNFGSLNDAISFNTSKDATEIIRRFDDNGAGLLVKLALPIPYEILKAIGGVIAKKIEMELDKIFNKGGEDDLLAEKANIKVEA